MLDLTFELSSENVPGTTSCRAKSSSALSELFWKTRRISYRPCPPPGYTSLPVVKLLLLWMTLICGGLITVLVATGPNLSALKSALAGAASVPLSLDGSGACRGYLITRVFPGWSPNGAEVPTVTLRECPGPSGDTNFSSSWMPFTTSTLN